MGARFSVPVQTGPGAHPASCKMGTGSFPVVKSGRGVTLTPHPLLVPWSRKSRAKPLLPLWAVRPVQSLSACTRVHFTFTTCLTLLKPNDLYISRTAPLTSKRCILYIYSTNLVTKYFKHALYSPFFSLQNAVCFIMLTCLVPVLFAFYIQVC